MGRTKGPAAAAREKAKKANSDLAAVLSLVASATTLSLRFLSENDLLLLPSHSISLHPLLRSSALSLSRLISLLLPHFSQTLTLEIPPPPPPLLSSPSWFLRFLSSSKTLTLDPRWLETFRMSRTSFYLLLQTLTPSLSTSSSSSLPIPADHKLAAALFRLAHAAPFPSVARLFGLPSPSLACRAFYEVLRSLSLSIPHLFEFPSDTTRVLQGFHWMSLPNCCGVLGYSRFPLHTLLQALVDSEGRFLDVSAGWHASIPPARILTRSKLFASQPIVLAAGSPVQLHAGSVPRYLLGGSCCPLLPWLLTPFEDSSDSARAFNTVHARGMELTERAFARLRARWKILRMRWKEECAETLPVVIVACCLLHNFLIKCSEPVLEKVEAGGSEPEFSDFEGKKDEAGEKVRGVLASHLIMVTRN